MTETSDPSLCCRKDFHANMKAAQVGNQSSSFHVLRACFSTRVKELAKELTQHRK